MCVDIACLCKAFLSMFMLGVKCMEVFVVIAPREIHISADPPCGGHQAEEGPLVESMKSVESWPLVSKCPCYIDRLIPTVFEYLILIH